jgi:predicted MFS family arabinose efflux permease
MSKREFREFYLNADRLSHDRRLPIVAFALFSSWLLAFSFQGPILHSLAAANDYDLSRLSLVGTAATCLGLCLAPRFVRDMGEARRVMLRLFVVCAGCSMVFFFPPTSLWGMAQAVTSFAGGACVAAWGYYFRIASPRGRRMEAAADMIVLSHISMIALSPTAVYVSGRVALALSIVMIACAYILTLRLPSYINGQRETMRKFILLDILNTLLVIRTNSESQTIEAFIQPRYPAVFWTRRRRSKYKRS